MRLSDGDSEKLRLLFFIIVESVSQTVLGEGVQRQWCKFNALILSK
jgi:hypothetical protein